MESLALLCKAFLGPFSLVLHSNGFLSLALSTSSSQNAITERLVAPSLAASHFPYSNFPL